MDCHWNWLRTGTVLHQSLNMQRHRNEFWKQYEAVKLLKFSLFSPWCSLRVTSSHTLEPEDLSNSFKILDVSVGHVTPKCTLCAGHAHGLEFRLNAMQFQTQLFVNRSTSRICQLHVLQLYCWTSVWELGVRSQKERPSVYWNFSSSDPKNIPHFLSRPLGPNGPRKPTCWLPKLNSSSL